ncbi:MAG: DUF1488 family protein [Burkholderiaceae bacterium]|jgi:hypothetical protein|nr:DUF1488 family protein [Burkholderiaceae bacterium]
MSQAYFHKDSAAVRFSVLCEGVDVGATVSSRALHYHFRPDAVGEDPLETYAAHADEIAEAVRRRVAAGSIEPVMLRELDLRAP